MSRWCVFVARRRADALVARMPDRAEARASARLLNGLWHRAKGKWAPLFFADLDRRRVGK
jgi:hypothetical protein